MKKSQVLVERLLSKRNSAIDLFAEKTRILDPVNTLKRGFTITSKNGEVVKDVSSLNEGDVLETQFSSGKLLSKVIKDQNG